MRYFLPLLYFLIIAVYTDSFGQDNQEIKKIKFSGNTSFRDNSLKDLLSIQKSKRKEPFYYSAETYEEEAKKIKSFYQKEGYLFIEIQEPTISLNKKNKVSVTFNITENDPIRIDHINFTVNDDKNLIHYFKPVQLRKIKKQMNTRKGRIFKDQDIINDDVVISKHFEDKGFPYVITKPNIAVNQENKKANIEWKINTGNLCYFGSVKYIANTEISKKSLNKQVAFKQGEVFSRDKIARTQDNLYNLGIYRIASTRSLFTKNEPDTIETLITLKEAPRLTTKWGLGYGRETDLRIFGQVTLLRFLGGSRRAELYAKHSSIEPYDFNLRLIQPALYSPNSQLLISPYVSKINEPGYSIQKTGGSITVLQKVSKHLNMSLGYQYEQVNLDTTSIADLPENETISSLYNKAGINYGIIFNNALPQFDPTEGVFIAGNIKTNGLSRAKENSFYKIIGEIHKYDLIRHGWILATKIKTGTIITPTSLSSVPIEERFFSGGLHSVRGYNRQELGPTDGNGRPTGGNTIFEASIENRFSLNRKLGLGLVIFSDIGNVWLNDMFMDFKDLYYTAGAGLRYKTPIGPIGIDLAKPIFRNTNKRWLFYISIGHSF